MDAVSDTIRDRLGNARSIAGAFRIMFGCLAFLAALLFIFGRITNPKRDSERMSGLKLPSSAELILSSEDFGYTVHVWKLAPSYLTTLQPPSVGASHLNPPGQWTRFDPTQIDSTLPPTGILPFESEKIAYQTASHSVVLERNIGQGILKISAFNPN